MVQQQRTVPYTGPADQNMSSGVLGLSIASFGATFGLLMPNDMATSAQTLVRTWPF